MRAWFCCTLMERRRRRSVSIRSRSTAASLYLSATTSSSMCAWRCFSCVSSCARPPQISAAVPSQELPAASNSPMQAKGPGCARLHHQTTFASLQKQYLKLPAASTPIMQAEAHAMSSFISRPSPPASETHCHCQLQAMHIGKQRRRAMPGCTSGPHLLRVCVLCCSSS